MPYDPETMRQIQLANSTPMVDIEEDEEMEAQLAFVDRTDFVAQSRAIRMRKNRLRMAVIGIPLFFGLTVFLAMYIAAQSDKATSSEVGDINSGFANLPPPPPDLPGKCSNLDSALKKTGCQEVCEVAECCEMPSHLPLSCLANNHDVCLEYHKYCHVVTNNNIDDNSRLPSSVPPAPANLRTICAADNLLTVSGFTECHQVCSRAECCYEQDKGDGTCTYDECDGYAPCLTLAATDTVHPDITKHVTDSCSGTNLQSVAGRAECRQACLHAICCFSSSDDTTMSCPQQDDSFCPQYAACNALEQDLNIRATADEIERECNKFPAHDSLCEVECERGACCFDTENGGCANVFPDNDCSIYQPCARLYDSSIIQAAMTVDEACKPPSESTINKDLSLCSTKCEPAKCCYELNSCSVPDSIQCTDYTACDILYNSDDDDLNNGGATVDPHVLTHACGAQGSTSTCENVCAPAMCCFEDCTNGVPDSINCDLYSPCSVLYDAGPPGNNTGGGSDPLVGDRVVVEGNTTIIQHCDPNFRIPGQASMCDTLCPAARCCFQDCQVPVGITCANYQPCAYMWNSTNGNGNAVGKASQINQACDPTFENIEVPGQPSLCESLCEEGKCCFPANNCAGQLAVNFPCVEYQGCSQLWGADSGGGGTGGGGTGGGPNDPAGNATQSAINQACDPSFEAIVTPGQPTVCETLCEPGKCCFDANSCTVSQNIVCSEYSGCSTLWPSNSGGGGGGISVSGAVTEACAAHQSPISGEPSLCENLCEPAKCCFADNNCFSDVPANLVCDEYLACIVLYDGVNNVNLAPAKPGDRSLIEATEPRELDGHAYTLEDVLTKLCLETDDLKGCNNVCKKGSCCFEKAGCDPSMHLNCDAYVPCYVLHDEVLDEEVVEELVEKEEEDSREAESSSTKKAGRAGHVTYEAIHEACVEIKAIQMPNGETICQQYCEPGKCCFSEEEGCPEDLDCGLFTPCANKSTNYGNYGNYVGNGATKERTQVLEPAKVRQEQIEKLKIDQACGGKDQAHCVTQCAEAACCYALDETEQCQAKKPDLNCHVYLACNTVFDHKQTVGEDDNSR